MDEKARNRGVKQYKIINQKGTDALEFSFEIFSCFNFQQSPHPFYYIFVIDIYAILPKATAEISKMFIFRHQISNRPSLSTVFTMMWL